MYILYKESNTTYPPGFLPKYTYNGRVLAKVTDNQPINFISGNVKTVSDEDVEAGAEYVEKWKKKYYILSSDGQHSSARENPEDEKVELDLDADELESSLKIQKLVYISNVEDVFDVRFKALNKDVPAMEQSTWAIQISEATAYSLDNSTDTPVLDILSTARGMTVETLSTNIVSKVNSYNLDVVTLLAAQQTKIDEIKSLDNCKDLLKWNEDNFGVMMPLGVAAGYGLVANDVRTAPITEGVKF